jgi:2-C-methyl-D-erythritol 4-phosphate cytidylyltransferase
MAAHDPRIVAAIVVAAGSGSRLGADVAKAFVELGARTVLEHAVGRLAGHPRITHVVVAAPAADLDRAAVLAPAATVVAGGATRQRSVQLALAAVPADAGLVLVHDAARAFVPAEVIDRVLTALETADGAVPTRPVSDTIRTVDAAGELGGLIDRTGLLAMQTPQGFRRDILVQAHARAQGADATDDVALVEAIGGHVVAVAGDERAFKITVPLDLALARTLVDG